MIMDEYLMGQHPRLDVRILLGPLRHRSTEDVVASGVI